MKKWTIFTMAFSAALAFSVYAESMMPPPKPGSEALEKMKTLVGTWTGTTMMQGEEKPMKVEYSVTAGGSAVVETLNPGTPMEMVSIYHDEGDRFTMTHYCVLGNQPHMALEDSNENMIRLSHDGHKGISDPAESHMHGVTLTFVDASTLKHEWVHYKNEEPGETVTFILTRSE